MSHISLRFSGMLIFLLSITIFFSGRTIALDSSESFGNGRSSVHRRNSTNPGAQRYGRFRGGKELCTEVKKYPGKSNGAFVTRDPGHWRYLPDGSMTYELATCQLKRFTAPEARRCLANHHTLMIGDSLMRYQYISLIYFLEHGRWPARFAMASSDPNDPPASKCTHFDIQGNPTCSPPGVPSVVSENDWANVYGHATDKSWRYMHQYIGGAGMNGHVECQCARSEADKSTEAMFYEHTFQEPYITKASVDAVKSGEEIAQNKDKGGDNRVRLSFLSNLGDVNVHLWNRSFCERTASCNLTAEAWYKLQDKANSKSWTINEHLGNVITKHLDKVMPDVDIALFNTGLWGDFGNRWVKDIMQRLFALVHGRDFVPGSEAKINKDKAKTGRCYWKGMSPAWSTHAFGYPDKFAQGDDEYRVASYESGCGVFDVRHVTKQFANFQWMGDLGRASCCGEKEMMQVYFDAVHFQPWVNEELNQILLNQLC